MTTLALASSHYCVSPWALFRGTNSAGEIGWRTKRNAIDIVDHYVEPLTHKTNEAKFLDEVLSVCLESSQEDWDGYGAQPLDFSAVTNALRFYNDHLCLLPFPEVNAEADGDLALSWSGTSGSIFAMSFSKSKNFNFAGVFSDGTRIRGVESVDSVDVKLLEKYISKATSTGEN
jgi:hypothetical protein